MLIDTHTHHYLSDYENGGYDATHRAIEAGVSRMIMPNVNVGTIDALHGLAAKFPDNIYMAMGLHPTEVGDNYLSDLEYISRLLDDGIHRYVAIGEIGMDLYWDKTRERQQCDAFERQLQLAVTHNLPIIIHSRDALDRVLEIMQPYKNLRGVFHSFGGSSDDVARIRRDHDFYFGVNGIVTFKNSNLRDVLPDIGLDRLLLETDSPYLAPVPMRGRRNESAYMVHIAGHIANCMGLTIDNVARVTTLNANSLFSL